MGRKVFVLLLLLILGLLCACSAFDEPKIDFADMDFSNVKSVLLVNQHNGGQTYIEDAESVAEVCDFLRTIRGENGTSAKGYYEGTYTVSLYANSSISEAILSGEIPLVSIGFGDSDAFYYGEFEDGYPVRYSLISNIIIEVVAFFKQYDQHLLS